MIDILLVDDEPAARTAFCDLIARETTGCIVTGVVANGLEALEFLKQNGADILVTDLKMPVMDGLELIHCLQKQQFPGVILVMSNYSDYDLVREALLSGAQDYLLKVNMSGCALQEHFDQAARMLAEKGVKRSAEQDNEVSAAYREGALYNFLLGDPDCRTREKYGRELLAAPPAGLFLVSLQKKKDQKAVPERSVKSVLRSVLGTADILRLPEGNYLCLTRLPQDSGLDVAQARSEQIIRQFHMYLNCRCGVVYSGPINTVGQLESEYELCCARLRLLFYEELPAKHRAKRCGLSALQEQVDPKQLAQHLTEQYVLAGQEGVMSVIDAFLHHCAELSAEPKEVCRYTYELVQVMILSDPVRATTLTFSRHAALLNAASAQELKWRLEELLPELLKNSVPPDYQGINKDVKEVMLYIRYHYMHKLTLEEIAASVRLDKSYLCRLFKKETGKSIFQYLNEQRMCRAAEMIEKGNTYVREVAAAVGIDDQFYFTRLFKRQFGVSPSEYKEDRKKAKGGNNNENPRGD